MTKEGKEFLISMLEQKGFCIKPYTLSCVHDDRNNKECCPIYEICASMKDKDTNWAGEEGVRNVIEVRYEKVKAVFTQEVLFGILL